MRRLMMASVALVSSISLSLPSLAATVQSIQGNVLINRGEGYQPITAETQISAGDSIMVSPGGKADVVYFDGCQVTVEPGAVMTIARKPPCETGSRMNLGGPFGGSIKDSPPVFEEPAVSPCCDNKLLLGALLLAGIAAIALLARDDDDRRRIFVSPPGDF